MRVPLHLNQPRYVQTGLLMAHMLSQCLYSLTALTGLLLYTESQISELTWRPPSPKNWFPARKGTWMTAPSLVISRATLFSMSAMPSKYAMSCFTMAFHAVKRSMRMSEGRRS